MIRKYRLSNVWNSLRHAHFSKHTLEYDFSTHKYYFNTHLYDFHTHKCDFHTHKYDEDSYEFDLIDTYECDF
jgi:hypothetical protein